MPLYLGIDVGTSGVRAAVIEETENLVATASVPMVSPDRVAGRPCQDANIWWQAATTCLHVLAGHLKATGRHMEEIVALSVDGTSGTMLLADEDLTPATPGYMYDSGNFVDEAAMIEPHAPEHCIARGAGSGLARLLFLQNQARKKTATCVLHQADWVAANLMGVTGYSDETNALKTGFDVINRKWPDWIEDCGVDPNLLPTVRPVADNFGIVSSRAVEAFGFNGQTKVVAGTTDSNAAFLASGASKIGEGVTSLGTTLAIKLLSDKPVSDPLRGIYSHRIKDMWLPGGASNSGGGVLQKYFTPGQMAEMEHQIDPSKPTGTNYYPLSRPGERFPVSDPALQPRLTPRPVSDVEFFQGMLEGISEIERTGYAALHELGTPNVTNVYTAGGGAANKAWMRIRSAKLGVPVVDARSSDAAVGTARIAAGLL